MPDPLRARPENGEHLAVGAYGLRVEGLSETMRTFLGPAPPEWPAVELRAAAGRTEEGDSFVSSSRGRVAFPDGGEILVERSPMVANVRMPVRPREEELLHPYLGYVAAVAARWLGHDCVHSGAFVVDSGVWGMVGVRGAGKSSTLGWLADRGYAVVCDDMLVIKDGRALPGPRLVDLRGEAAAILAAGELIGVVGTRERWRLRLGPVRAELPMRGWIFLDWAPDIQIGRVPASRRLLVLKEQLSVFTTPRDPTSLLELAALPAWELRRPRGWDSLAEATERLFDTIAG